VGPSVGFVRSYLALWAFAAITVIAAGGVNELLGLGLFVGGYPALGGRAGYGEFALQAAVVAAVALALSVGLQWWDD
jgi:uncharacterized membrane protein